MTETAVVARRSRWHRLVEWFMPWYDPEAERRRNARSEAIRQHAVAARIDAEHVRDSYREYAKRLDRR